MTFSAAHTFATIVFDKEVPLLKLQASSFERFMPDALVESIHVIYNSPGEMPLAHRTELLEKYGRHKSKVTFWAADQLCDMPLASGWDRQQILKLAIAHHVKTKFYVVLDAKTHLVSPLTLGFLQTPDGRPCTNSSNYRNHALKYALDRAYRYFKVDIEPYIEKSLDTVTPFIFYTDLVIEMMQDLSRKDGRPFSTMFLANGFAEFTLYSAWLTVNGYKLEELYSFHQIFPALVWDDTTSYEYIQKMIKEVEEETPFMSIHRRAFEGFDEATVDLLAGFWVQRGLFATVEQGRTFIGDFRRVMQQGARKDRAASLALKPIYFMRRVKARVKQMMQA
ncbi:MAG: DUF6492 family protein [Caulobacteraceae bacterium]